MTLRDPIYLKAKTHLSDGLDEGRWRPGDKLPSERDLARQLLLDRNLVRHALMALEGEGRVMRLDRRGWFATPPRLAFDPVNHVNFARAARDQGRDPGWQSLQRDMVPAPGPEARAMRLPPGTPLLRTFAWGALDGVRVYVEETFYNPRLGPVADTQWRGRSTTEVWEEDFGIRPRQRNLLVRPVRLAGEVLEVLALAPGAPGVYIRRIKVDEVGNVIEIDHEYWRFDAVEFRM
ncbi:GntR family transcriptional regulator [Tistrella mobilis]|uniref:Transcriptional regulator n=2 Tax=Tistrella mobilis TaxID=171437 RepID=I3TRA8_TISMK|nr:GntR family transcriptional regulator [Tistrella mobilis]AFK55296.1 putative transcriptional regulator [Tistrella mobilis KA081020-065]KYO51147.1 hypothetical protein AUP44_10255 [Tistrella mobilis]